MENTLSHCTHTQACMDARTHNACRYSLTFTRYVRFTIFSFLLNFIISNLAKNIPLPRNDTIMYGYLEESIEHTLSELFKIVKTKDQLLSMTLASVCLRK